MTTQPLHKGHCEPDSLDLRQDHSDIVTAPGRLGCVNKGTSLLWHIAPEGGGSRITLIHKGLNDTLDCRDVCARGWQKYFEHSLREHLCGGQPTPETR